MQALPMSEHSPLLLGADHAGFRLKESVKRHLLDQGLLVEDVTPEQIPDDDYPPIAHTVAEAVAHQDDRMGILICGSGFGMDMAANRVKGARAAVVRTVEEAVLARKDDHANILVLGGRMTDAEEANRITDAFLTTPYSQAERHMRRVDELDA